MPKKLPCPGCERRVRIPDELVGKPVQCPACKKIFTFRDEEEDEASPPPGRRSGTTARPSSRPAPREEEQLDELDELEEADDDDDDRPRRRKKKKYKPGHVDSWKQVKSGLGRIIASMFTALGTSLTVSIIIGVGIAAGITLGGTGSGVGAVAGTAMAVSVAASVLGFLGAIAVLLLAMTGLKQCREAPDKYGCYQLATIAYNLMLGAIGCMFVMILFSLVGFVIAFAGTAGLFAAGIVFFLQSLIGGVMGLLTAGSMGCFLFFLRGVARAVYQPGHATNALMLFILFCVAVLIGPAGGIGSTMLGDLGVIAGICGGCFGVVLPLGWSVWFVVTLFMTRGIIQQYLEGKADTSRVV